MTDLWVEASRDLEAENAEAQLILAKMATASLWPFLALAKTEGEFNHRLALAEPQIDSAVPDVILRDKVVASFRDDFVGMVYQAADAPSSTEDLRKRRNLEALKAREEAEANGEEYDPSDEDWRRKGSVEFFHEASGQWIRLAVENAQPHNPSYDDPTPEAGPETGIESRHFPTAIPDPYNPINAEYPAQPQAWIVPPDKAWIERPMNFAPYQQATARTRVTAAAVEWEHSKSGNEAFGFKPGTETEIAHILSPTPGNQARRHWAHYYPNGFDTPEDQEHHFPVESIEHGMQQIERLHANRPKSASVRTATPGVTLPVGQDSHYTDEGVETGTGPNPNFFAGGTEGATGDPQASFPADVSLDEPDERVEWYNNTPPQPITAAKDNHGVCAGDGCGRPVYRKGDDWFHLDGDSNHHVLLHSTHPWVQQRISARVQAEYKYVHQRGDKWVITQKGTGKVLSEHDSQDDAEASFRAMMMHKHEGSVAEFHDPFDQSVRMVRRADVSSSDMGTGQDASTDAGGATPNPPPSMIPGGPGAEAAPMPQTIPNAGVSTNPFAGGGGATGGNPTPTMPPTLAERRLAADVRERPSAQNPSGVADEYDSNTWEGPARQRPMQGAEERGINTPQRPHQPIPQMSSTDMERPEEQADEEDEED